MVPPKPQRVVLVMCDGFGLDYLAASDMPTLARWKQAGIFKSARGVMPSVTNANNASICCGTWPPTHGITGNSYWDERTGQEEYMESASLLLTPTLFERAARPASSRRCSRARRKRRRSCARGAEVRSRRNRRRPNGSRVSARPLISTAGRLTIGCCRRRSTSFSGGATSGVCTSTPPIIRCTRGPPPRASRRNTSRGSMRCSRKRSQWLLTRRSC